MKSNKVIFYGEVLVDMSQVTVKPETLGKGETALDASGELITGTHECPETELPELNNPGTASDLLSGKQLVDGDGNVVTGNIPTKTASNLTASGATVTVPAGYYASQATKSVATATQATPSVSIDSAGKITASATQTAGYVAAGTKTGTKQLTTQAAQTITPGTSDKTIASGRYLTGTQTIKGDSNLKAENIKSGVSIFGVAGSYEGSGGSGGGGENVACTVEFLANAPVTATKFTYLDANFVFQQISLSAMDLMMGTTITCVKNSVIYSTQPVFVDAGNLSTQTMKAYNGILLAVLGDGTFVIN